MSNSHLICVLEYAAVLMQSHRPVLLCILQAGSEERQQLEARMEACNAKIKVLNFCVGLQLTNTLSKKQLAAMCVHSHPFVFDALSICEACDVLSWKF